MTAPLPFRVRRFIAVTFCSLLAIAGVFMFMCLFTDLDSPSILGSICFYFLVVAMWPAVLWALILHGDPPVFASLFLFVMSGLFWASVVDLFFVLRKRRVA
jgi:hypothetical protein